MPERYNMPMDNLPAIWALSDQSCSLCKMSEEAASVCEMGDGPAPAKIMVIGRMPNSETYQAALTGDLKDAGLNPSEIYFTSAIKCRNFDVSAGRRDLKTCATTYLHDEIKLVDPEWILVMGNEALSAVLGKSGITKYRARVFERGSAQVVPTVSPASVARNPGQRNSYMADLRFFAAQVHGRAATIKPPTLHLIWDMAGYRRLRRAIRKADLVSFDVETTATDTEFSTGAAIICLCVTLVIDDKTIVFGLPLYHPESPFRKSWRGALKALIPDLETVHKRIAHNGKYDCRWLRRFSEFPLTFTFDTMFAAHLLDENREKGLKPQATSRLGVAPWAIETKDLLNKPIKEVLEYCCLDTFYTYHIYRDIRAELLEQPRLLRIFTKITMPACNNLITAEQRGVWTDRERLEKNTQIAIETRADIERQLMEYVPAPLPDESLESWAEAIGWPTLGKRAKLSEINFNPSNWSRWWLFEYLRLPVIARGKPKDDGSEGNPSMAEDVMLELRGVHPAVDLMLARSEWQKKVSAFFEPYNILITPDDRIHTTFKLAGTVTGRLSSGKEDLDKITAKKQNRGVNLQQVPRDTLVRGLFGAKPGYAFVEADFSQIELRIAAYLSRDSQMMRLYQSGADIHKATAATVLGIPESKVTKDDRKKAKAVNFGFVYGMGWKKFIYTAFTKYQSVFTEDEARAVRRAFFDQFPGLLSWHNRQRRLVEHNRRVQNPLGRVRHLPDIDSPDQGVRAEAERQAINSPVQGFGSDLCVLSMNLLVQRFAKRGLDAHVIGNVHDALLFEIQEDALTEAVPLIKRTMENLPLERMFGLMLDVPIVAEVGVGSHWGETEEYHA